MCVKAGLLGYMRSLAYDYGPHNIRVNSICPGAIRTRISPSLDSEHYKWQVAQTLLGRVGQPEDIGNAALYLASDEANFVTGIMLTVDGGNTIK
jgi:NAD(P)-dependent dehydrogenase (short-subunit alcohol dehydrogenase family)